MSAPIMLYDSILEDATVTLLSPDSEVSATSTDLCLDRLEFTRLGITAPGGEFALHADLGSGGEQAATAIALTGHSLSTDAGSTTWEVSVDYSDNDSTWTSALSTTQFSNDLTIFETWTHDTAHRYWRINFSTIAGNWTVDTFLGALALGEHLEFTERVFSGFDRRRLKHRGKASVWRGGEFAGVAFGRPEQSISFNLGGSSGLARTDFFGATGTPSWDDFERTCWADGAPFWFAWDGDSNERNYCWASQKAPIGHALISPGDRQQLRFEALALAEGAQVGN